MKIYTLPISDKLQPSSQPFRFPEHNRDYGVEQDFRRWLEQQGQYAAGDWRQSDWHYLPVYWTRWHLNHDYGKRGREELQSLVNQALLDDQKTFTICQYADGPGVSLGQTTVFLASRRTPDGIDIPLLSSPHRPPLLQPRKRYLASFVGRLSTHPLRGELARQLESRDDVFIRDRSSGARYFARKILQSYVTLCPKGYGGNTFRFFEAMQLGSVPYLIGEPDTRPFAELLPWDEFSLHSSRPDEVSHVLEGLDRDSLGAMGARAAQVWMNELRYQRWCKYVLLELEALARRQPMS